jgi:hypothetical protein
VRRLQLLADISSILYCSSMTFCAYSDTAYMLPVHALQSQALMHRQQQMEYMVRQQQQQQEQAAAAAAAASSGSGPNVIEASGLCDQYACNVYMLALLMTSS